MNTSDEVDQVAKAMVEAVATLDDIVKSSSADLGNYSYRYADLAAITGQTRPALAAAGLVVTQSACRTPEGVGVITRLWHSSGQWIEADPLTIRSKGGAQDDGSAITYARRYSLLALLGLATEDDDGRRAQEAHERADAPHPLSKRVAAVKTDMKALDDEQRADMETWAGKRWPLTPKSLLDDEAWLEHVEAWLDEHRTGE